MNISYQYFKGMGKRLEIQELGKGREIYTGADPTRILRAFRMVFSNKLPTMSYGQSFCINIEFLLIIRGFNGKGTLLKCFYRSIMRFRQNKMQHLRYHCYLSLLFVDSSIFTHFLFYPQHQNKVEKGGYYVIGKMSVFVIFYCQICSMFAGIGQFTVDVQMLWQN